MTGRQAHLPFGEEFAGSGSQQKHHFTSYEAEGEIGTDYAVNRQYSQSVGRFHSADPYQASDYMVNPQSWNRYSYVENDPIHNVDPLGLMLAAPRPPDTCSGGPPADSDATPGGPSPSCSIGINFTSPLSSTDQLSFGYLPSGESRETGPTNLGPFGLGWFYRVEISGTVPGDVSTWRIRQEVQMYFSAEYADGSVSLIERDNSFRPDDYTGNRSQQLPGQDSFYAIDAPGQHVLHNGKEIVSLTLHMNFNTWAEFNVQGLGRICPHKSWHVSIVIKNGRIKTLSAGLGHLNI